MKSSTSLEFVKIKRDNRATSGCGKRGAGVESASRWMVQTLLVILTLAWVFAGRTEASPTNGAPAVELPQGIYFAKKQYVPHPLPKFSDLRGELPSPLLDGKPEWVGMYWKAWELAFRNFYEPAPASGFMSQFIDAAFDQDIFMWDSSFMTMFCNVAYPLVPGIGTLDNFYAKQHPDGEICREIVRNTGMDVWVDHGKRPLYSAAGWTAPNQAVTYEGRPVPQPPPLLTLDGLDHPIMAWAEVESVRYTDNTRRVALVYPPLVHFYQALRKYLRQGNGLYVTDWASMDNSPRNPFLKHGGCAVDTSCEMVLFARNLATLATMLHKPAAARRFNREADTLSQTINRLMWDSSKKFYFDLTLDGKRAPVKTVAAFWALVAGVASPEQARCLVAELNNPKTFDRAHRVPTLAADEPGYDSKGGYWRGSVWAPTTTMVIRGLQRYGYADLAHEIALNDLEMTARVFQQTGTLWENYAPDAANPGQPARKDFVGWSGLGPILYLLEFGVGLQPNALENELDWIPDSASARIGCEHYRFNGHVTSLILQPAFRGSGKYEIKVESDGAFTLRLKQAGHWHKFAVQAGKQNFTF